MADMRRRSPEPPPGRRRSSSRPGWRTRRCASCAQGNTTLGAPILEQIQPASPDTTTTVDGCIGTALGLLDDWLTNGDPRAPKDLGQRLHLPAGHWLGERAATDILVLARKGRAFPSLNTLITRQGGNTFSTAAPSPSPPQSKPGQPTPARQSPT